MGSAWCKNQAADTDNSKSTLGRVIVRCVNQMCPAQRTDPAADPVSKHEDDKDAGFQLWGVSRQTVGPPLPDRPPPHTAVSSSAWQSAVLTVPEPEPPVPPPRTKRRRRRQRDSVQPLGRSLSLAARPSAAPEPDRLKRAGSACELSTTGAVDHPRFVFDFTSYDAARTPPPSPARDDEQYPVVQQRSRDILRDLGLPASLREGGDKLARSRASSGRSSMTPSLSELEAALSDLLEAGAAREDEDEESGPVAKTGRFHQAPPIPKEVAA